MDKQITHLTLPGESEAALSAVNLELIEAVETMLAEARERGGGVTTGERLGCAALLSCATFAMNSLNSRAPENVDALREALEYTRKSLGDPVPIGRRHVARKIDAALSTKGPEA